jgi:hypothetical protein
VMPAGGFSPEPYAASAARWRTDRASTAAVPAAAWFGRSDHDRSARALEIEPTGRARWWSQRGRTVGRSDGDRSARALTCFGQRSGWSAHASMRGRPSTDDSEL